jgi:hypothetical protein
MNSEIGVTRLIKLEGGRGLTMGVIKFNLRKSQITKRGKNGLKQSLIYMHPFTPFSPQFILYLPLFNSVVKKIS